MKSEKTRIAIYGYGGSKLPGLVLQELVQRYDLPLDISLNPLEIERNIPTIVVSFNGKTIEILSRLKEFFNISKCVFVGYQGELRNQVLLEKRPYHQLPAYEFSREACWDIIKAEIRIIEKFVPFDGLSELLLSENFTHFMESFEQRFLTYPNTMIDAPIIIVVSPFRSVLLMAELFFGEECRKVVIPYESEDFFHGALLGILNSQIEQTSIRALIFESQSLFHTNQESIRLLQSVTTTFVLAPQVEFTLLEELVESLLVIQTLARSEFRKNPHDYHRSLEHQKSTSYHLK